MTRRKPATESSQPADAAEHTSGLGRQLLVGFLAGASAVIGLLLFLSVVLFLGGLAPLLYEITGGASMGLRGQLPFWSTVGAGVVQSLARLPGFFWSARWAIVGLGLLGMLLAFVTHMAQRIDRPWRGMASLVVTLGIVGAIVFAIQYANREVLLLWLAGQPYLLTLQNDFLLSNTASVLMALLVALAATYAIWGFWHWWYMRWSRWLYLEQEATAQPEPIASEESWLDYQARMHRSKRTAPEAEAQPAAAPSIAAPSASRRLLFTLLAILAGTTLALAGTLFLYNQFGSQLGSGDLFVSAQAPEDANTLSFNRTPRQVIIASINGQGAVDISLGSGQPTTPPARQVERLELTTIGSSPATATVDLTGLEPGSYWLKIVLREGGGGQLRYAMLQGGGGLAQAMALLVGVAAGIWLAVAALVLFEFLAGARGL